MPIIGDAHSHNQQNCYHQSPNANTLEKVKCALEPFRKTLHVHQSRGLLSRGTAVYQHKKAPQQKNIDHDVHTKKRDSC
jgi:hypothetical protein